jgi:cytochrome c biogenesis protein CcmG/thiol:disulfide interchange protein DsbE
MRLDRRTLLAAPLGFTVLAGGAFYMILQRMQKGTFDPRGVPTMLSNKPLPDFNLPGIDGDGFGSADLARTPGPVVLNFFASWCAPCVEEHRLLINIANQGVPIWGIAYKDAGPQAGAFLKQRGNPYLRTARDDAGRVAIDFGITGVPESFVVDRHGIVRWHIGGPLTAQIVVDQLMPTMRAWV